jgi:hypothetical protein
MAPIISRVGFDKGFGSRRGSFLPTYSVSPSTSSVNEGSSVTFTVTTTNVPNSTTLYWTLNTISGTVNSSDFTGGETSGSFTITNNSGSVALTLANDVTTEGSESFQLQVRTDSTSGTIVATSSTVTINDTSVQLYSYAVYADLQGGSRTVNASGSAGTYGAYDANTTSVSWGQSFDTVGTVTDAIRRNGDNSLRIYWQMNPSQPWTVEWYQTGGVDADRLHTNVLCWDDGYNQIGGNPPGASIGFENRYGSNGIVAIMNGVNVGQGAGQLGSVSQSIAPAYIRITHNGSGTIQTYIGKGTSLSFSTTQPNALKDFVFIIGGTTGDFGMNVVYSTWSAWKSADYINNINYRTSTGQAAYFKAYAGYNYATTWPSNFALQ